MTDKKDEALKLALEDLLLVWKDRPSITAIREALTEPPAQQEIEELTAQRDQLADILTRTANALKGQPAELSSHSWHDLPEVAQQLKAAQRKPWTGLTDEEIEDAWPFVWRNHESVRHFAIYHAIEAKLKEKNA